MFQNVNVPDITLNSNQVLVFEIIDTLLFQLLRLHNTHRNKLVVLFWEPLFISDLAFCCVDIKGHVFSPLGHTETRNAT